MHNTPNAQMQQCIDDCIRCYQTCLQMAMNHCLETGGKHVEPLHFRLMINCAEICRTAADFMLSSSPLHAQTYALDITIAAFPPAVSRPAEHPRLRFARALQA